MMDDKQRAAWEKQAYGCRAADLDRMADNPIAGGRMMLAMSILSDAQHLISEELNAEYGGDVSAHRAEEARQFINRAKYLMAEFNQRERALEAALPDMRTALDKLDALTITKRQAD